MSKPSPIHNALQFPLGLFGHARPVVSLADAARACGIGLETARELCDEGHWITIEKGIPNPHRQRTHVVVRRFSVEGWFIERESVRNGVEPPYIQTDDIKWWREELRKRKVFEP